MTATFAEANDEILTVFKDAWDTTGWTADYENVQFTVPATAVPWARPRVQHGPPGGQTLAGADGSARYERQGVFTAQIFVPKGEGLSRAYDLAKIVADAFEGVATPSQVWFRNGRIVEANGDGSWSQLNFLVEFTYDELK